MNKILTSMSPFPKSSLMPISWLFVSAVSVLILNNRQLYLVHLYLVEAKKVFLGADACNLPHKFFQNTLKVIYFCHKKQTKFVYDIKNDIKNQINNKN